MIKFNCIIHKETGIVIEYKELVGYLEREKPSMKIIPKGSKKGYYPRDMIFSDDFEIIYNSEFSNLELITLYGGCATRETGLKLKRIIEQNQHLKRKYGIEV